MFGRRPKKTFARWFLKSTDAKRVSMEAVEKKTKYRCEGWILKTKHWRRLSVWIDRSPSVDWRGGESTAMEWMHVLQQATAGDEFMTGVKITNGRPQYLSLCLCLSLSLCLCRSLSLCLPESVYLCLLFFYSISSLGFYFFLSSLVPFIPLRFHIFRSVYTTFLHLTNSRCVDVYTPN